MNEYFLFNRQIWELDHVSDYKPTGWKCGKCGIGQLRLNVSDKMTRERLTRSFSSHLRCTNSRCDIPYHAVGRWGKFDNESNEVSISCDGKEFKRYFYPLTFVPTLVMFRCSPSTPDKIVNRLEEAFKLYWLSQAACANAIRTVLERIMDAKSVQTGIPLHKRLESFGKQEPVNANRLLAIKWIGNSGSHDNDLDRNDVLDGFEILAKVLSGLFPDTSEELRIEVMVADINKKKKPRSK